MDTGDIYGAELDQVTGKTSLERAAELAPVAFLIVDATGTWRYANRAFREQFGVPSAQYNLLRFGVPASRSQLEEALERHEVKVPARWYQPHELLWSKTVFATRIGLEVQLVSLADGLLGVWFNDVTAALALRETTEMLERSEKSLAAAQRITRVGSWELDLSDLKEVDTNPLRWSDEVFRLFGYQPGGVPVSNETFFAAVHPGDRGKIADAVKKAIETGVSYSLDHRVVRPDGSVRVVHEQSELQYAAAGNRPIRMIGTVHDVTEQRAASQALIVADRMASVGTLAAGVAHEINNPLAAIACNLELAEQQLAQGPVTDNGEPLLELVRDARIAADRVRDVVRDLKNLARGDDDAAAQTSDINTLVEITLRLAANEIRHRAVLVKRLNQVPAVVGSESRLGQVLLNLVINAAQAIPEGSVSQNRIEVETRLEAGGMVAIDVIDTGCGMTEEVRRNLFTPFFTTKPVGVGIGLGLSICQRVLASLGGSLRVHSEPGSGATFTVLLPVAPSAPPQVETPAAPVVRRRGRVLVLDDQPMLTSVVSRMLGGAHDVIALNDANEAIDLLQKDSAFDVILCDVMMPRMTGVQFYDWLQTHLPHLTHRVVFMTGGAFTPSAQALLAREGVQSIDKPFKYAALLDLVAAHVPAPKQAQPS